MPGDVNWNKNNPPSKLNKVFNLKIHFSVIRIVRHVTSDTNSQMPTENELIRVIAPMEIVYLFTIILTLYKPKDRITKKKTEFMGNKPVGQYDNVGCSTSLPN